MPFCDVHEKVLLDRHQFVDTMADKMPFRPPIGDKSSRRQGIVESTK